MYRCCYSEEGSFRSAGGRKLPVGYACGFICGCEISHVYSESVVSRGMVVLEVVYSSVGVLGVR